jgi:hypothetical protein
MKRWLTILLLCAPCFGQAWSGIIDPSRATDWTHAGSSVINESRTQCATSACLTVTAGTVTTASIQAAINSVCTAPCSPSTHQYILIPAGSFSITGGIQDTGVSNVTLRGTVSGTGAHLTSLVFSSSYATCDGGGLAADFCVIDTASPLYWGSTATQPGGSNACNWTAGYTQGTTTITLNSCGSAPPVNQFIILDQASDTTDNSGVFVCNLSTCNNEGALSQDGRSISGNSHAQQQFVYVTAVSGTGSGPYTVTIAAPGLHANNWCELVSGTCNFSGTQIGAWWPGMVQGVGLESITMDHRSSSTFPNGGEEFYDCYNCWAKDVTELLGDQRNHFWLILSPNFTLRDSYTWGSYGAEESYGIEMYQAGEELIENNIFDFTGYAITNGSGSGSVFSYNYFPRSWFSNANMNWMAPPFNHNVYGGDNLWEGNSSPSIQIDDDWGTDPVGTMFRNWLIGRQVGNARGAYSTSNTYNPWDCVTSGGSTYCAFAYVPAGSNTPPNSTYWFVMNGTATWTTENTQALQLYWGARAWNLIGNVLGDSAYDNNYIASPSAGSTNCVTSIFNFGYRGNQCTGSTDTLVQSSVMLWGNYDTVNAAVRFNSGESSPGAIPWVNAQSTPSSHTLPASFYLSAKPAFYTVQSGLVQPPYPGTGPDVTGGSGPGGYAYANPAQACYNALTQTSGILNFSSGQCYYGSSTPTTPPAPASVMFAWDRDFEDFLAAQ